MLGMSRKMSKGGGNQTKTETGPLKWYNFP